MGLRRMVCGWLIGVALCACGGSGGDGGEKSSQAPRVAPPSTVSKPVGQGCAQGASQACTCTDGRAGTSNCQVDGTFSVCTCTGAVPGNPGMTAPPVTGTAGSAAAPAAAGSAAAPPGQMPPPEPTGVVNVPPEDVMACSGAGTPPMANEQVEVLQIRTDKVVYNGQEVPVVPGGFKAMGGTLYACFWVELDMPEKHHIIGWEGAVGGDRAVHHQQVSLSAKPFYLLQQGGLCGLPTVDYTWTGERPTEWTPGIVGYPIGGP